MLIGSNADVQRAVLADRRRSLEATATRSRRSSRGSSSALAPSSLPDGRRRLVRKVTVAHLR